MERKLHDNRGETLVEMLASILIAALSVAVLFTCCLASVEMGRESRAADEKYYEALSEAERREKLPEKPEDPPPPVETGKVTVGGKDAKGDDASKDITINLYGGEEMYSYKKGAEPGDP